jgi:hypothetical protein
MLRHCLQRGTSACFLLALAVTAQAPAGFVASYLDEARGQLNAGDLAAAAAAVDRALERDGKSLPALQLRAEIAQRAKDTDAAVHTLHRWLDVFDARSDRKVPAQRKAVLDQLLPLDSEALSWGKLQSAYVSGPARTSASSTAARRTGSARSTSTSTCCSSPPTTPMRSRRSSRSATTGGREVAVEDVYAGADPTAGMSEEELAKLDAEHSDWEKAYTDKSDNYNYRTNAGFLVLKTSRIAMEQMNGFYRRFFHFMEDGGKTPAIEIRIFKNRRRVSEARPGPTGSRGRPATSSAAPSRPTRARERQGGRARHVPGRSSTKPRTSS